MQKNVTVAIAGASGYVGGELIRLLSTHPQVTLGALAGASSAGTNLAEHHPHLAVLGRHEIVATSAENLHGHDVVFLALPHGSSAGIVEQLDPNTIVIDCGADYRLSDPAAWEKFYGGPYSGSWPYGMPELAGMRGKLRDARRIAVPGCYPTAATLAIAPALSAGLIEPDVVVVAASGTSGAGKKTARHMMSAEVMGAMAAYGVGGGHRHTPEMVQNLGGAKVSFTPLLAPMARGIIATVSAPASAHASLARLRDVYERAYLDEPFVHLLPPGKWPTTAATLGSNMVHVQIAHDAFAERVVAVAAIDNLVKGAAGQAVQCLNLALGLPETMALPVVGVAP
ncbi:MAG: N-acetyl-gamma-glutamyl-phosphate reductase [Corynebacteriales bacterium]|nr:N-acetyl-gamma-glutamyl-phosphate reductase [Mycobacteriales bacterium]